MRMRSILASILLALLVITPVAASTTRAPMAVGDSVDAIFVNRQGGILGMTILRAPSPADALAAVTMPIADLEDAAGITVLDYDDVVPVDGASATRLFMFISKDGTMKGILTLASAGSYLYMMIVTGKGIEASTVQRYLEACIATTSIAPEPRGYTRKD